MPVGISASLLLSRPLGPEYRNRTNEPASADILPEPVRLAGGWWLVLVCSERRILLAGLF
jgi:hypothetical protein